MTPLQRIRWLLQQPWIVGVLSLVAVAYVARNIVVPLVRMYGGGSYVARSDDRAAGLSSPVRAPDSVLLATPDSAVAPGSGQTPADVFDRRFAWFDERGQQEVVRNPFLAADDPRQPGYRPPPAAQPAAPPERPVVVSAPVAPADLGLELTAVMRSGGGRLALINRQVVAEGDAVAARPRGNRGLSESAQRYRVEYIGERDVVLSGNDGQIMLVLPGGR